MDDRNSELLFEYLRSILYDEPIHSLDVELLDGEFQKLGKGMQYLEKAVAELKEYSAALARGNLSVEAPARDNFLCENLKSIHAHLNHLTWQAKQVAKGDYTQNVSFLGEFSEAFNKMTEQLRERECSLKLEAEKEKTHAAMMDSYNQLLINLINRSEKEILVISADEGRVLYYSREEKESLLQKKLEQISHFFAMKKSTQEDKQEAVEWIWEMKDSECRYYKIITALVEWQGQMAYAHIIHEVTEQRMREEKLEEKATQDALTQIGNRYYFQEHVKTLLKTGEQLTFCYCDLDHLKYVNDQYGHIEGDWYIQYFVEVVKRYIREEDVFARLGGDEFCIVFQHCPYGIAKKKMEEIQDIFVNELEKEYPKNFSFGILELLQGHEKVSVADVIRRADTEMYRQKKEHNKNEKR